MTIKQYNNNTAIELINLFKEYILHHEKPTLIENFFRPKKNEKISALKEINLTIKKGEKVAVIGDNGSGKTTLLKIITGITSPTTGEVITSGKVAALIDLEAGFHPELTGEENIYLNGMLLGMSKKELKKRFDRIIDFSGIKEFIDVPLYTYSNGMILRLGFSIAAYSDPDILLLDEVLAVGDRSFKEKSFTKIQEFFKKGKTIVYISHYMEGVLQLCPKTIWLENGKIKMTGESKKVIKAYQKQKK